MEGQLFGGVPMNLELRLSVEDSPEQRRRRDRPDPLRQAWRWTAASAGPIHAAASAFCKHPPRQMPDDEAFAELERFIRQA